MNGSLYSSRKKLSNFLSFLFLNLLRENYIKLNIKVSILLACLHSFSNNLFNCGWTKSNNSYLIISSIGTLITRLSSV